MPTITRNGYSAGKFLIELEGALVGVASAVSGGDVVGLVGLDAADTTGLVKKHISALLTEKLTLTIGVDMGKELGGWVAGFTARTPAAKDGAVVFVDYDGTVRSRLEWSLGWITEVRFPGGDATDHSMGEVTVTIVSRRFTAKPGATTQAGNVSQTPKSWIRNAFRVRVDSAAADSSFAGRVEELVVRRQLTSIAGQAGPGSTTTFSPQEVSDVVITIPEGHTTEFAQWLEDFLVKGNHADGDERNGTFEYLGPSLDVLATLSFKHLGITRMAWELAETGNTVAAQVKVHLYCEEVLFALPASTVTPPPPDPTADSLLWAVRRLQAERDGRVFAAEISSPAKIADIAARLAATAETPGSTRSPGQQDGFALGQRWAAERATVDEFIGLSHLDDPAWTAISLPKGHSLIDHLRDAGVLRSDEEGPVDLRRGPLVEGIAAGVADVRERLDSAAGMGETASLRLQMAMDRRSKMMETLSNLAKKSSDTDSAITQNIK